MLQFILNNKASIGFAAYVVYSVVTSSLPDDMRQFDAATYWPHVLKALSGAVSPKFASPKVKE